MINRYAEKRDGNEKEIIAALKRVGATVQPLAGGNGRPDLLVGYKGCEHLLEVKNPKAGKPGNRVTLAELKPGGKYHHLTERYGTRAKWLKKTQARWFTEWQGSRPFIVMTVDDALAAIGIVEKEVP